MAAQKPTVVFSPPFSTILTVCQVNWSVGEGDAVLDRAEQDAQFKQTHGMGRNDWDAALSLHLHGDLQ